MKLHKSFLKAVAQTCKLCIGDSYNSGTIEEQITVCNFKACIRYELRPILPHLMKKGVPDLEGIERLRIKLERQNRKR
jgi:hypothetical protein